MYPASSSDCICAFSSVRYTCLCALDESGHGRHALRVDGPAACGGRSSGAIETIFPARTTIEPRSITVQFAPIIRAFVIVTSCAKRGESAAKAKQVNIVKVRRLHEVLPGVRWPDTMIYQGRLGLLVREKSLSNGRLSDEKALPVRVLWHAPRFHESHHRASARLLSGADESGIEGDVNSIGLADEHRVIGAANAGS